MALAERGCGVGAPMRGVLGILLSGRVERDHHAPEAARRRGGSGHGRRQFNKLLFVYIYTRITSYASNDYANCKRQRDPQTPRRLSRFKG